METVIQITVACVLGALLTLLVKRTNPESALLLTLGVSVVAFLFLSNYLQELMDFLEELAESAGVSAELLVPLYKTLGIALVVRIGGSLCRDAGESALAAVIETAGSVCALLAALPLFRAALDLLLELME